MPRYLDIMVTIYVLKWHSIKLMPIFNANAGHMAISAIALSKLMHSAEKKQQGQRKPGGHQGLLQSA